MAVFTEPELRRIAKLRGDESETSRDGTADASGPPRAGFLTTREADRRFDVVEIFERRGGRLHRRVESGGQ